MHVSGARRGSDQGLCCVISIGCTISTCSTMHPPSTRTRSSRSQMADTPFSHSGCRAQTVVPSIRNVQSSTLLQRVTSSSPIHCRRIQLCSWYCAKRRRKSGCERLIGLRIMVGWFFSMHIPITCPSATRAKRQKSIR